MFDVAAGRKRARDLDVRRTVWAQIHRVATGGETDGEAGVETEAGTEP